MHKKNSSYEKHEFAFFCKNLPAGLAPGASYKIDDHDVIHRMVHVVRVEVGEVVLLFRGASAVTARIDSIVKNGIVCTVIAVKEIEHLQPPITWYLPLLDREAFEESVSILTSMGAAAITPIVTEKSDKRLRSLERLERVMIAAAEQSKQLLLPTINPVEQFAESGIFRPMDRMVTLFFDPAGQPAFEVICQLREQKVAALACIIGPEGDLTHDEKELLRASGVIFCALTPTVLRAEQAVTVAMGLLRSCDTPAAGS